MILKRTALAAAAGLLLTSSISLAQTKPQDGFWRGTFTLSGNQESPFNFELKGTNAWLLNGSERFELKGVSQKGDSLFIPVEIYDAVLAAKLETDKTILGVFKRPSVAPIPFKAEFGKRYRFVEKPAAATVSLHGKWDVTMGSGTKTVGVFNQSGNKVTGTFLSTTGDYRFFEGTVQGDEFSLSAFSGSSPQLLKGKINGNEFTAELTNPRASQTIKGIRNAEAALPDAYTLTKVKAGTPFAFTFPDAFTGKPVSLSDPKFKGKAVVVTILGSWCPNCLDEASFLVPWYQANKQRGVEIIGLAFERKNDPAYAKTRLEVFKKRFGVEYDILFAGTADVKYASSVLPALENVMAFPTTIFVNRQGEIAKVHTGYSGPATGQYYAEFVKEFNADINELLGETPAKASVAQPGKTDK
ncbi:TlpA disulfide reductase family protein [Spirosoma jeollabukense]